MSKGLISKGQIRRILASAAGAAVTAFCLAALYRGLDAEALAALRLARLPLLALCLGLGLLSLAVRTERWRSLLLHGSSAISFPQAFWTSAAGQMLNAFLPARAGDAFRGVAAATAASRAFSIGTILVERILDTGVVVLAALGALALAPTVSWWMRPSVMLLSAAVILAALTLAALPWLEPFALNLLARFRPAWRDELADLFRGMRLVSKPGTITQFVLYSIAAWGLDALGIVVAAHACGAPQLDFAVGILLVTALAFASAIPATGAVGVVPLACAYLLPPFGVARGVALAIGIVLQSLNLALTVATGGLGLLLLRYRRREHTAAAAAAVASPQNTVAEVECQPL